MERVTDYDYLCLKKKLYKLLNMKAIRLLRVIKNDGGLVRQ